MREVREIDLSDRRFIDQADRLVNDVQGMVRDAGANNIPITRKNPETDLAAVAGWLDTFNVLTMDQMAREVLGVGENDDNKEVSITPDQLTKRMARWANSKLTPPTDEPADQAPLPAAAE